MDVISQLLPVAAIFGLMYFLMIRPQLQEKAAHDRLLQGLVRDDRVVTAGGLHGRVVEVAEQTLTLEIAKGAVVTVDKGSVAYKLGDSTNQAGAGGAAANG